MSEPLSVAFAFSLSYYATAVIQTIFHRLFGHTKRLMPIYRSHTHGHHAAYSRNELLKESWIAPGRHVLWYFAIPLGVLSFTVYATSTIVVFASYLSAVGFSFWWHIFLHRHYHLRGSNLERFGWFRRKRTLHFVHHRHTRSNYAISEYWLDKLMGTYRGA